MSAHLANFDRLPSEPITRSEPVKLHAQHMQGSGALLVRLYKDPGAPTKWKVPHILSQAVVSDL